MFISDMEPLTRKQQRFVTEYLVDLNATQAAIRSGYSAATANVTGSQILAKPSIAKAIDAAAQEYSRKIAVTQEDVVRGLMAEAQAPKDEKGSSPSARVQAWAHLGKFLGMFVERSQNVSLTMNTDLSEFTLSQLQALLGTLDKEDSHSDQG
jgi:hypothetical protein